MGEFLTILPSNATPLERAIEQTSGERWANVDVDIIRRARRAWECPPHLLNFLAYELSVDIWDKDWPDLKKRSVVASALLDHRLKGTLAGTLRYLEIADAELVQVVTPPQDFFASPDLSKEDYDSYIALHPKVRVPLAVTVGEWTPPDGHFADHCFVDEDAVAINDGWVLRGRRAYLVMADGREEPLQYANLTTEESIREGVEIHQVITPGVGVAYSFVDEFVADDSFADAWDVPPQFYTYETRRDYLHSSSSLGLTTVPVGFIPRDTRYVRESATGDGSLYQFADYDYAGNAYAGRNDGGDLLADVIRLLDPTISVPQTAGMSFAGHSRVGMAHHTAEMLIDWRETYVDHTAFVCDASFAGEDPATPNDTSRRDFLLGAVAASQRFADRIGVSFETVRPRTLTDGIPLDGQTRLGDYLRNSL